MPLQEGPAEFREDLNVQYKWYGNIRELKNIIFRAVLLSGTDLITSDLLPEEIKIKYLASNLWKNTPIVE